MLRPGGWVVAFVAAFGIISGPAYTAYQHFDPSDPRGLDDAAYSYLPMADGTPYRLSVTHGHRVVVPFAARMVASATGPRPFEHAAPGERQKHLRLGFLVVNSTLMAAAATIALALGAWSGC